jgi:hypothetical protein
MAYGGCRGGEGGRIVFRDTATGDAASVCLTDNATLDLSGHQGGITLANLDLAGGVLCVGLGPQATPIAVTQRLALRGTLSWVFAGDGGAPATPTTLLAAPGLDAATAAACTGNAVGGRSPRFAAVDGALQVSFAPA